MQLLRYGFGVACHNVRDRKMCRGFRFLPSTPLLHASTSPSISDAQTDGTALVFRQVHADSGPDEGAKYWKLLLPIS